MTERSGSVSIHDHDPQAREVDRCMGDFAFLVTANCPTESAFLGVELLIPLTKLIRGVLPVSFGTDTNSPRSLLSGVYDRGSKTSLTGGKCVTCSEWYH